MQAPDFYIPVDKEITQFAQHLQTHHRTILSAKFGDGKSYFIDKFEKDKGVSAELKIVKVYPVNYQIASNTDIFTLLKYDILLQLLVNDMVSESSIRGVFLDREDGTEFLTAFLEGIVEIEPTPNTKISASALPLLKVILKLPRKWKIWKGGKRSARTLIQDIEKSVPLYCEDSATRLIRQSLREWREKEGKKIVLVVEDLDRLDPAHLFRILNVFSAHMDFIYRNGDTPDETLVGSRFGFDSIVFVLEYENLKRIFKHFYGDDVAFSGYINKFIPQGYFEYSLRKVANSFFFENLSRLTGMEQRDVAAFLDPEIQYISIRDMANALKDVENSVTLIAPPDINLGFLLLLVVMKRIGMDDASIFNTCDNVYKNNVFKVARYVFDFTKIDGFSDELGKLKVGQTIMFYEVGRNDDGFPELGKETPVPNEMTTFNMHFFASRLMAFIKQ